MDEGGVDGRLSFLGRWFAPAFEVRLITLAPGQQRSYVEEDWSDALVVVERGVLELVFLSGERRVFVEGDVLFLDGLPVRALRNGGRVPALLSAITRTTSSGLGSGPGRGATDPFSLRRGLSR